MVWGKHVEVTQGCGWCAVCGVRYRHEGESRRSGGGDRMHEVQMHTKRKRTPWRCPVILYQNERTSHHRQGHDDDPEPVVQRLVVVKPCSVNEVCGATV